MIIPMATDEFGPSFAFIAMIWATAIFQVLPVVLSFVAAVRLRKRGWTMTFIGAAFVAVSVWVFSSVGSFANLFLNQAFGWNIRPDDLAYSLLLIGVALAVAGSIAPIRKIIEKKREAATAPRDDSNTIARRKAAHASDLDTLERQFTGSGSGGE